MAVFRSRMTWGAVMLRTVCAVIVALLCATPVLAHGGTALVARGQAGSYPWQITAFQDATGVIPGICVNFEWASGPGQPLKNGYPSCAASYVQTSHQGGGHWTFDISDLIFPIVDGRNAGIRGVVAVVDPRASTVVVTLAGGEVLRLTTHALPRAVHRDARIAWSVTGSSPTSASAPRVASCGIHTCSRLSAVAYDRRGRRVARYVPHTLLTWSR